MFLPNAEEQYIDMLCQRLGVSEEEIIRLSEIGEIPFLAWFSHVHITEVDLCESGEQWFEGLPYRFVKLGEAKFYTATKILLFSRFVREICTNGLSRDEWIGVSDKGKMVLIEGAGHMKLEMKSLFAPLIQVQFFEAQHGTVSRATARGITDGKGPLAHHEEVPADTLGNGGAKWVHITEEQCRKSGISLTTVRNRVKEATDIEFDYDTEKKGKKRRLREIDFFSIVNKTYKKNPA